VKLSVKTQIPYQPSLTTPFQSVIHNSHLIPLVTAKPLFINGKIRADEYLQYTKIRRGCGRRVVERITLST
jgi:hypothetical protein